MDIYIILSVLTGGHIAMRDLSLHTLMNRAWKRWGGGWNAYVRAVDDEP